jgi:glycosyltransferase involved in cell wall biosynthesis
MVGICHSKRKGEISKLIDTFKPDLILTQLTWSDVALLLGKEKKIPTVLRVCKTPLSLDIRSESKFSPTEIICASKSVQRYIKEAWGRDGKIIYPAIDLNDNILTPIKAKKPRDREYIIMFNPLRRKGGDIFKSISKVMSSKKFGVVYGWASLKRDANSMIFSRKLIKRICESEGRKYTGKLPIYVRFNDCKNVKIIRPEEKVHKIYSKTKILLIPSQWDEAFGRISIESMANGIPTIGSNVGGLKESVGKGGIIIKGYSNSEEWIKKLIELDDEKKYLEISRRGKKWVKENYSMKKIVRDTYLFFKSIISN